MTVKQQENEIKLVPQGARVAAGLKTAVTEPCDCGQCAQSSVLVVLCGEDGRGFALIELGAAEAEKLAMTLMRHAAVLQGGGSA